MKRGIGDFPRVNPTEAVTAKGVAVLAAFFVAFAALYALSYPLGRLAHHPVLSVPLGSTSSVFYLALALVGLYLAAKHRAKLDGNSVIVSVLIAAIVWLAIQAKYWSNDWGPYIPYFDPTLSAIEVFLMLVGSIGLLRSSDVLRFRLAEDDDRAAVTSLGLGVLLGLPFAALNAMIFAFVYGQLAAPQDVLYAGIVALQPGIVEEVAYRLLFMGLALAILLKSLPRKLAIGSAILMAVAFHAAVHAPQLSFSHPITALATVAVMGLFFGLPMAYLAYRRDIETAIGFHWVVEAVRFSLGF